MRKLCLLLIIFTFISCNKEIYQASFETENPQAYIAEEYKYDRTSGIIYKVTNDSAFIHFEARISDQTQKLKLTRFGGYLWIKGEKKSKLGIHFPLAQGMPNMQMKRQQGNTIEKSKPKINFEVLNQSFEVIYNEKENDVQWFSNSKGLPYKCNLTPGENKELIYQVSVSKENLASNNFDLNNLFDVNFVIDIPDMDMMERPTGGGGMRSGGGAGMGSGMPGGGRSGSTRMNMQAMQTVTIVKIKNIQL
jgi:hypothetical protein